MKIYESKYAEAEFSEELQIAETRWTGNTEGLDDVTLMNEFRALLVCLTSIRPLCILADTTGFRKEMTELMQQWIVMQYMQPIIEHGTFRYAILVSPDTYQTVSHEIIEENTVEGFEIQYFTSRDQALEWLTIKN